VDLSLFRKDSPQLGVADDLLLTIIIRSWGLFFNGYEIHTTLVANRKTHDDMLDFAARHGVKPTIQLFEHSAEGITEAFEKLQQNKVRYRAVMAAKQ
jgi:D-arabinose 1-dehydrogenase-like Zn-dependent alcohol dehydrogenase